MPYRLLENYVLHRLDSTLMIFNVERGVASATLLQADSLAVDTLNALVGRGPMPAEGSNPVIDVLDQLGVVREGRGVAQGGGRLDPVLIDDVVVEYRETATYGDLGGSVIGFLARLLSSEIVFRSIKLRYYARTSKGLARLKEVIQQLSRWCARVGAGSSLPCEVYLGELQGVGDEIVELVDVYGVTVCYQAGRRFPQECADLDALENLIDLGMAVIIEVEPGIERVLAWSETNEGMGVRVHPAASERFDCQGSDSGLAAIGRSLEGEVTKSEPWGGIVRAAVGARRPGPRLVAGEVNVEILANGFGGGGESASSTVDSIQEWLLGPFLREFGEVGGAPDCPGCPYKAMCSGYTTMRWWRAVQDGSYKHASVIAAKECELRKTLMESILTDAHEALIGREKQGSKKFFLSDSVRR